MKLLLTLIASVSLALVGCSPQSDDPVSPTTTTSVPRAVVTDYSGTN